MFALLMMSALSMNAFSEEAEPAVAEKTKAPAPAEEKSWWQSWFE